MNGFPSREQVERIKARYCDRFGFKQIAFEEAPQTLGMAECMSQSF